MVKTTSILAASVSVTGLASTINAQSNTIGGTSTDGGGDDEDSDNDGDGDGDGNGRDGCGDGQDGSN